jgi:hypothetical protein
MRDRLGDKAGTRALIEVLLLRRKHPRELVDRAIDCALELGTIDAGTVALIPATSGPSPRPSPSRSTSGGYPATTGRDQTPRPATIFSAER